MSIFHPTNLLSTTGWLWWRRRRPTCISLLLFHTFLLSIIIIFISSTSTEAQNFNSNSAAALIVSGGSIRPQSVNLHEPRIELRYNSKSRIVSLDERSPNNTVVAIVFVSDEDTGLNGETSVAIESGNEFGHFKLVVTSLSNTVQVSGAPLSKLNVPEYNLTLVARDRGIPPKMSSVNLVIKLTSSPPAHPPLEPLPSSKPPVGDLMYVGTMLVVIFSALIFLIIIGCALVQRPRGKKAPLPSQATGTTSWSANQLGLSNL